MIPTTYVSPSEQRALMATIDGSQDAATVTDEFDAVFEQDYESRNGFELAVAYRHDPESFALGGPLYGLHPAHARQVAGFNPSTPLGWTW